MKWAHFHIALLFTLLAGFSGEAQIWVDSSLGDREKAIQQMGDSMHAQLRPFQPGMVSGAIYNGDSSLNFKESQLSINAYTGLTAGYQVMGQDGFVGAASPGIQLSTHIKDKLWAEASYAYQYERLPNYLTRYADSLGVMPGVGYAVRDGANYASHYYTGKVAWNIDKVFSVEVGRDKHFWGDGYRTLIVSHNAAPYPYAKINTQIWKVRYINLWTQMRDIHLVRDPQKAPKKFVAMHGLSYNVTKWLNLSAYEMVIYQAVDTLNNRGIEINYVNPIIFYRPVEFQQGSADNVILAFSMGIRANKKLKFYGQLLLDEFLLGQIKASTGWWGNKFGYQLGFKVFDMFKGFNLQSEFNAVRPFTYTHGSVTQAYGHLNQGVAHPLGTNFMEWVLNIHYGNKKWTLDNTFIWANYGRDPDDRNMGGNIFRSYASPFQDQGNTWAQGLKSALVWNELKFTYLIFEKLNLRAQASFIYRNESNQRANYTDGIIQIGFVSNLMPVYRDF
ncbi:MAG: hypothetical protein KDC12_12545 [Flavobacteriales bacterium]|nr:hypothetical protein [Flavobacteriales bacterium]